MTPEAKALEIVEFDDAFKLLSKKAVDRIHDAITQALRDVERETLERAGRGRLHRAAPWWLAADGAQRRLPMLRAET